MENSVMSEDSWLEGAYEERFEADDDESRYFYEDDDDEFDDDVATQVALEDTGRAPF